MKLSASPTGVDTVGGVVEWLRAQFTSIAAGWGVEHTPNGAHGAITTPSITFPATQAPSTDANTLDDYEEGAWTPDLTFGGGSTGLAYSSRGGVYCKVGKLVTATAYLALSARGSSTGSATIAGLPFTSDSGTGTNANSGSVSYATGLASLTSAPAALVGSAAASIVLYDWGATGVVNLDESNFTNASDLGVTVSYRASA